MVFAPQRSQFSDASIPMAQALSLCGPAAAIVFAQVNGRTPTLKEAMALAREVGWSADSGMAGPQSEQALLRKLGVEADLTPSADWGRVTSDVQAGRPVIISTPRHYFTVSDVDPQKGFYVGTSGTDLKGGSEWMTADQIAAAGRGVNGALHLSGAPAVPRERQQFLEANDPGGQTVPASAGPSRSASSQAATVATPSAPTTDPSTALDEPVPRRQPAPAVETPEQRRMREMIAGLQAQDAFSRHIAAQIEQVPPLASQTYQLPGLPQIDLGWHTPRYALPGGI